MPPPDETGDTGEWEASWIEELDRRLAGKVRRVGLLRARRSSAAAGRGSAVSESF